MWLNWSVAVLIAGLLLGLFCHRITRKRTRPVAVADVWLPFLWVSGWLASEARFGGMAVAYLAIVIVIFAIIWTLYRGLREGELLIWPFLHQLWRFAFALTVLWLLILVIVLTFIK
ncbi:hypothetical protein IV38_GL000239 [Lactobacillus selangorensis]|uniref:Uncharacterized protein n=1 Tax=Lactobacillus selangorensis TaxID=81857 RepID=A0A0R2GBA4_9LACO|nr:DUF3397 family protein [Lactobacillus selangorensis]KRN29355.1 hypothetical protein IV38_GL000239 [Lactobacillus selangorensis]KRN34116.1 hypothetical protein IV40_GL000430 [Lactobacillus selangorensis]